MAHLCSDEPLRGGEDDRRGVPRSVLFALALGLAILPGCADSAEEAPEVDPTSARTLTTGQVVGYAHDTAPAHVWRGLPFARPPTGPLRWRAPLPPEAWEGVREATLPGNECVQVSMADASERVGDEDCLVLDVYAPRFAPDAVPADGDLLPVMVWIHGGGNSIGSALIYDGARLAADGGVLVIPIQYRLGLFGWLTHPALRADAATPEDASGNYGTLDTIRALEWVRDNARAFGGDPNNITIFGESAGGMDVFALLLSPRAKGLFHRAISQSGILETTPLEDGDAFASEDLRMAGSNEFLLEYLQQDRRADDREAAQRVLSAMSLDEIATYLRSKTPDELLAIFQSSPTGGMYSVPQLFRDGHVIVDAEPLEALADPALHNAVPTIAGTNREETKLFAMLSSEHVSRVFGVPTRLNDPVGFDLEGEYGGLLWKAQGADEPLSALSRGGRQDIWGYRFDWDEEGRILWLDLSQLVGAAHMVEVLFVFHLMDLGRWTDNLFPDLPTAERLSAQMRGYWTEFARTGKPGRAGTQENPEWQPWGNGQYLLLDTEQDGGVRMQEGSATVSSVVAQLETDERVRSLEERCAMFRGLVLWSGAFETADYERFADGACQPWPLDGGRDAGNL